MYCITLGLKTDYFKNYFFSWMHSSCLSIRICSWTKLTRSRWRIWKSYKTSPTCPPATTHLTVMRRTLLGSNPFQWRECPILAQSWTDRPCRTKIKTWLTDWRWALDQFGAEVDWACDATSFTKDPSRMSKCTLSIVSHMCLQLLYCLSNN